MERLLCFQLNQLFNIQIASQSMWASLGGEIAILYRKHTGMQE